MIPSKCELNSKRPSLVVSSMSTVDSSTSFSSIMNTTNFLKPTKLPDDYEPRDMDILCGRGRGIFGHAGNRRFKQLVEDHAREYVEARTKMDKGVVVASLVDSIRDEGILFVKKDSKTQCWYDIGEYQARDKTSHAIRDYMSKSSIRSNQPKPIKSPKGRKMKAETLAQTPINEIRTDPVNTNQQSAVFTRYTLDKRMKSEGVVFQPTPPVVMKPWLSLSAPSTSEFQSIPEEGNQNRSVPQKRISDDNITKPDIFRSLGLDYLSYPCHDDIEGEMRSSLVSPKLQKQEQMLVPYKREEITSLPIQRKRGASSSMQSRHERDTLQLSRPADQDLQAWSPFFPV